MRRPAIRRQHRPIQLIVDVVERLDLIQPDEALDHAAPRVHVPAPALDLFPVAGQGVVQVGQRALLEHRLADRDADSSSGGKIDSFLNFPQSDG
jgi:hypothetical protein